MKKIMLVVALLLSYASTVSAFEMYGGSISNSGTITAGSVSGTLTNSGTITSSGTITAFTPTVKTILARPKMAPSATQFKASRHTVPKAVRVHR